MNYNNNDDFDIIKMESKDIYSNSKKDIYSHSFEDISSHSSKQGIPTQNTHPSKKKRKKRKKHTLLKVASVFLCLILVFGTGFYIYGYNLINKIKRTPLDTSDLNITTSTYTEVKNIALLGLDTRDDNKTGRSDANVILTVDKTHKKIKLTSIARDSYVAIDGHSKDKLTHAYAFGRSQLSVKTLNKNFGLEITDYVTMNFFELARVIDYIGGVTIDVDKAEMEELNSYIIPRTHLGDIKCEKLTSYGVQLLSGGQAVCYARIRHTDGDIERGNRQKEVLTAIFSAVKKMNPLKLPELASLIIAECETSLLTNDIISLGIWAILATPEFENLSIPNDNVKGTGKTIGGKWCYTYDLEKAANEIKDFIFEQNYYSAEEKEKRSAEQNIQ